MTQVINTGGGGDSGAGVVLGVLAAVVLAVGGYYLLAHNGAIGKPTTNINVEAPSVPSAK